MTTFWLIMIPLEAPALLLCSESPLHMLHAHKSEAARRTGRLLLFLGSGLAYSHPWAASALRPSTLAAVLHKIRSIAVAALAA